VSAVRAAARALPRGGRLRLRPLSGRGLVALVVLALLAGGWLWLRDSELVAVREVHVSGARSGDTAAVRLALRRAAQGMTTLRVSEDDLRAAVRSFPQVADVRASPELPHGLEVEVVERRPVAAVGEGAGRLAVAADGTLLRGVRPGSLPRIRAATAGDGRRLGDARARRAVALAAAAPPVLLRRSTSVRWGRRGFTVALRDGPKLVFGSAARAGAKWAAAARVMADTRAAGATFLDVRIPGRVAVGGLGATVEPEAPIAAPGAEGAGAAGAAGAAAEPETAP